MVKVRTRSGIEVVEGDVDRLGHAADHPHREVAIEASEHAAAQDDVGAAVLAEARERHRSGVALPHEAIEIVDQRIVTVAAVIAQHGHVGEIDARRQILSTTASCGEW